MLYLASSVFLHVSITHRYFLDAGVLMILIIWSSQLYTAHHLIQHLSRNVCPETESKIRKSVRLLLATFIYTFQVMSMGLSPVRKLFWTCTLVLESRWSRCFQSCFISQSISILGRCSYDHVSFNGGNRQLSKCSARSIMCIMHHAWYMPKRKLKFARSLPGCPVESGFRRIGITTSPWFSISYICGEQHVVSQSLLRKHILTVGLVPVWTKKGFLRGFVESKRFFLFSFRTPFRCVCVCELYSEDSPCFRCSRLLIHRNFA